MKVYVNLKTNNMTLKEEYIKLRNENKLNVDFLYKYYVDNCKGTPVNFTTFMQVIQFGNTAEIFSTIDKAYNLTTLHNKEGLFLKVVE